MQLSLFLEVRKLLKLQGVAYLEGRIKSRSYGNTMQNCTRVMYTSMYTCSGMVSLLSFNGFNF